MSKTPNSRIESLDLLRGIAAISVAISHYYLGQNPSNSFAEQISIISVELFFVLSGFVLAPQILSCISSGSFYDNIKIFMARRWMRTVPPYLVALICATLAFKNASMGDFLKYAFYVQNFFAQHMTKDYFFVAWSLSVEEWFYVIFPASLFFVHSKIFKSRDALLGKKYILSTLFIIFAIVLNRYFSGDQSNWGENIRRVVIYRIDSISYGFLAFLFISNLRRIPSLFLATGTAAFFSLSLFVAEEISLGNGDIWKDGFLYSSAAFGVSSIVLFYRINDFSSGRFKLYTSFCSFLGRTSYSVYLFHSIVLVLMPNESGGDFFLLLLIYIGVVLGFAYIFYLVVEKPILARRPRYDIKVPNL
jgi:peptidoglycan/LPS O-acetylase OafA/YrhL